MSSRISAAQRPTEMLVKAELGRKSAALIAKCGLAQAAAELLKVDQSKALVRGRLAGFSLDRFVRFLVLLSSDVEIFVNPRTRGAGVA